MTDEEKLSYKKALHLHCSEIIKERIRSNVQSMDNAQAAANSEEKSSAGDKYETSRAMSHREKDMQARQLAANRNELAALLAIDDNKLYAFITTGSVIICDECSFYIAAGLGKTTFQNTIIYLISPHAPVADSLLGKIAGDKIMFNKKEIFIVDIF